MSKYIRLTESRYGSDIILNLDQIVVIDKNVVHTSTVHGEGNGMFHFTEEGIAKIIEAIGMTAKSKGDIK